MPCSGTVFLLTIEYIVKVVSGGAILQQQTLKFLILFFLSRLLVENTVVQSAVCCIASLALLQKLPLH